MNKYLFSRPFHFNQRLSLCGLRLDLTRYQPMSSTIPNTNPTPTPNTPIQKLEDTINDMQTHHFKNKQQSVPDTSSNFWPNPWGSPIYSKEELISVQKTHVQASSMSDRLAYASVKVARWSFDLFSGYRFGQLTEDKVFKRAIFLETVAGVPGFVAGILRHLQSLRRMERDFGWIHTLLMEAENERMHLLTFIKLKQPSLLFRASVVIAQGVFMNGFFVAYLISPKFCHRFVGYLEEEAVKTYTDILSAIDDGRLQRLKVMPAPDIAIHYWRMDPNASVRDLVLAVRADEANHRDVNHTFANLKPGEKNPHIH